MYHLVIQVVLVVLLVDTSEAGCMYPQKSFDMNKFFGTWKIITIIAPELAEPPLRCIQLEFAPKGPKNYHANLTGLLMSDNTFYSDDGPMTLDNPDVPAKINITWKGLTYSFTVIDTDYTSYAATVGCLDKDDSASYVCIFGRGATLPEPIIKKLTNRFVEVGVKNAEKFYRVDNSNCGFAR